MHKLRFFLISLFCFCALSGFAKHLSFMGIPINGTITTFQSKLASKGCNVKKLNFSLPAGVRMYSGVFAGHKSDIFVYFNTKTKIVYKVRVLADKTSSLDIAHDIFKNFKSMLCQKYEKVSLTSDQMEDSSLGEYEFQLLVLASPLNDIIDSVQILGTIGLDITDSDDYNYSVRLDYIDKENSCKNENSSMDDL